MPCGLSGREKVTVQECMTKKPLHHSTNMVERKEDEVMLLTKWSCDDVR